jgi:hypothetical protein
MSWRNSGLSEEFRWQRFVVHDHSLETARVSET